MSYSPKPSGEDVFVYGTSSDDTTKPRPSYAVTPETHGTDVVADYAAALAASSIAFTSDTAISKYGISYSDELLQHSAQLYEVAKSEGDTSKRQTYEVAEYWSSGYFDELAWAAVWLAYAASTTVSSPTSSPVMAPTTPIPTHEPSTSDPTMSPTTSSPRECFADHF